jgi:uncharacterized RDD family membrane protein YckC
MTSQATTVLNHHVLGRRILAALIDGLVIGTGFAILAGALGDLDTGGDRFRFHLGSGPVFIYVIASLAYFTILEGQLGATLGKMAMSLRVVKLDGSPCGLAEALIRNVLRVVDAFPAFYLLGMFIIALTPRNQRIGDLAASTLVVSALEYASVESSSPAVPSPRQDVAEALRDLAKLRDEGLLTDEEYESKRKELADRL